MTPFETCLSKMDYEVISRTFPTEFNGPFTQVQTLKVMIDLPSATTNNFDIPGSPAEIERMLVQALRNVLPTNVVFAHNIVVAAGLTLQHRWGLRNKACRRILSGHFMASSPMNTLVFENMVEEVLP